MIETSQPQPANMPWEPAPPTRPLPLPALAPFPTFSRAVPTQNVDLALGRHQLLEIAIDHSWTFESLPPEAVAALRAGVLEPQRLAVERGKGSAISLASLLLQVGDIAGARKALEHAPSLDYWSEHMHAMCFWQAGDIKAAEDLFRSLSGRFPQDPRPLHALGKLLSEQRRFADAVMLLRAANEQDPESAPLLNDLGAVLIAVGKHREALQSCRRALRLAPSYALALANSGVAHYQLGHKAKAVNYFHRALVSDPHCVVAVHNLAECLLERGDWDATGDLLRRYIKRGHKDARAHELLAWAYLSANRLRDAQEVLESDLRLHQEPGLLNNLATVYAKLRDFSRAQAAFQTAIMLEPENSQIRANFAHFLATFNAWPRVAEILRACDVVDVPDRAALLAQALFETNSIDDAVRVLRDAQVRFGELRFDLMLGHALASRLGRPEDAIEVYRKALQTHTDERLLNNLGYALILAERFDEAREVLDPAYMRQHDKSDATALYLTASYGLLKIRQGHYNEGIALYREAYGRARGVIKQRLKQKIQVEEGTHYVHLGNIKKARPLLRAAVGGPDVEFRMEAERLLGTTLD